MKKELFINYTDEARVSYVLCALLNKNVLPWFYENYVNICIRGSHNEGIEICDIYNGLDKKFMDHIKIYPKYEINDSFDMMAKIKKHLDLNYYISLWVDEYFLPCSSNYGLNHYSHPVFLYGYDDDKIQFNVLHFDIQKGITKQIVSHNDIKSSFDNLNINNSGTDDINTFNNTMVCYKINDNIQMQFFNINNFLMQLHDYIFSKGEGEVLKTGISIYKLFLKTILDPNNIIPFSSLYTLSVQKKFIYNRLLYIQKLFITNDCFKNLLHRYKSVVDYYETAKLLNLKYSILTSTPTALICNDIEFIEKLSDIITKAQLIEEEILLALYNEIRNINCVNTTQRRYENFIINKVNNRKISIKMDQARYLYGIGIVDTSNVKNYNPPAKISFSNGKQLLLQDNSFNNIKYRYIQFSPSKNNSLIFEELDNTNEDISLLEFHIYTTALSKSWNKDNIFDDWDAMQNIPDIKKTDTGVEFKMYNHNPCMQCKNIFVDGDVSKYIYVSMKSTSNSSTAQLYFTTSDDNKMDIMKLKTITVGSQNDFFNYIIDMSDNPFWKGAINFLRFDPAHYDNKSECKCIINKIEVCDIMPVYNSKNDFTQTQGVNGWFYYQYDCGISYREMIWDEKRELWAFVNNENSTINAEQQSSAKQFSSVRRWICPATGNYKIKYNFKQLTTGTNTCFIFRKNHAIINKLNYNELTIENYIQCDYNLEIGEMLSFEFMNYDELRIDTISINILIFKEV